MARAQRERREKKGGGGCSVQKNDVFFNFAAFRPFSGEGLLLDNTSLY